MTVEDLFVDAFDNIKTAWTKVIPSPYLNDSNINYIYTATANAETGYYSFPNSGGSITINSVKLRFEAKITNINSNNSVAVYLWDGSTYQLAGYLNPSSTSYGWFEINVTAILDSWAKINGAKFYLKFLRVDAYNIYVRRGLRRVDYTAAQFIQKIITEIHGGVDSFSRGNKSIHRTKIEIVDHKDINLKKIGKLIFELMGHIDSFARNNKYIHRIFAEVHGIKDKPSAIVQSIIKWWKKEKPKQKVNTNV